MMRRWPTALCRLAVLLPVSCFALLHAQEAAQPQTLTVWIVRPVTSVDRAVQRAQADLRDISTYHESTAGSFGTPASDVGQTAGSYGKPASEGATNASDVGQTAGSYGQTASSLPGDVKSQTAGSYGQTAGSFGMAASDFNGIPKAATASDSTASRDSKGAQWRVFLDALHAALPHLQARFVEVSGVDLRARLAAGRPDVLLSDRLPDWWPAASRGNVLVLLGSRLRTPSFADAESAEGTHPQTVFREACGLAQAPHPAAAREFLEWWFDRGFICGLESHQPPADALPAVAVAQAAVGGVLAGGSLEALADKDMAGFSTIAARNEALGMPPELPRDLSFRTEVVEARANGRFAVVLLHTRCMSASATCDLYPLLLLRASQAGADHGWKVLHLSLGMSGADAQQGFGLAAAGALGGVQAALVSLPKLASPTDGDQRAARSGLDLWWDNAGGASLLVVEWQQGAAGRFAEPSHLYLVRDTGARLRTEVPAPFTSVSGAVRWRVWALGRGGMVAITEWRTVTMVP